VGNAHFVVLDAETEVLPEFVCTQVILWWDACLNEAQRRWLEDDLEAAGADPTVEHVFVLAHEGPYSSKPGRTGWAELRWLLPWFARNKVAAIFSGHDHLYEHGRASNGVRYVVSGGGGAPLYETEPEGSLEVHPRDVVRNEVIYNYQVVEVEGADVRVSTYECDGELLEAFEVRAAAPCADPADCAGELHDVCPGAWACDAGRCRWACPDEPECVAAPMCAHLEPGEGSGR
jgi:3',5'-cyclic AMP phosphodiesterase CpdA